MAMDGALAAPVPLDLKISRAVCRRCVVRGCAVAPSRANRYQPCEPEEADLKP
jgi:hypothetical protein